MSLFIISDLHIQGPDDPLYDSLLLLLRKKPAVGDHVVLAGDLFDFFVGNKPVFLDRYHEFLKALKEAGSRGVRLYYIEGNHDFLIQRAFKSIPNLNVYDSDFSLEIDGKRFYFAHGDLVDQSDYGYLFLRAFFRSLFIKLFVWLAPSRWIEAIGNTSSHKSRKRKPTLLAELPSEKFEAKRIIYRSFAAERLAQGFDFVVLGHCHDLDEKHFTIGSRTGQYINVGYPRVHGSLLSWTSGDPYIQRERLPRSSDEN